LKTVYHGEDKPLLEGTKPLPARRSNDIKQCRINFSDHDTGVAGRCWLRRMVDAFSRFDQDISGAAI
jgi:hypothetical protein